MVYISVKNPLIYNGVFMLGNASCSSVSKTKHPYLDGLFSERKEKSEWITEASACLVGLWLKREEENMLQSTDKCHEIF